MWLEYARAIAATVVVALSAFGFGAWIARILPESISGAGRAACCWLGGFGLLGVLLFVAGQWSLASWVIVAIVAAGIIAAIVALRRKTSRLATRPSDAARSKAQLLPAAIVLLVLLLTAIAGLAEPVGDWGVDGVAYHLLGPKVWLREQIVRPVPDNSNTAYPATAEMVFAALMSLGGPRAPGFSAAFTFAAFLLIAAALARRCGLDRGGAWWCAALIATMPAVGAGAHSAFVDAIYAAFVLAAARVACDAKTPAQFAAVGLFCGLAMATKYTGLVATLAIFLVAAWPRTQGAAVRATEMARRIAIAAMVAFAVAIPFYLRNWLLLGFPIFPPPASVAAFVHIKYLSADALRSFYAYSLHRGRGYGHSAMALLLLPFHLTYHTAEFNGAGGIGLAPLALAPIGVMAAWRDAFSRRLAILAALLALLWFFTMQESRYLIHAYAIGAVFGVLGWRYLKLASERRGALLAAIVVACSVLYGLPIIVVGSAMDIRSVFSAGYAEERRDANIPFVAAFDYLNYDTSVTKVLILDSSVPPYYLNKDYVKPFGQWGERTLSDVATPADALARIDALRISHVLDVRSSVADFQIALGNPRLQLVFERPSERVYRVAAPN